ncbi:Arabinanase/levansucrase/invertase [Eremomyces bilateralis CBS 781.70]|uniref:Arabinanase/levansucrase/invertase n=1 Tax=Eremomyces bilateralis CBS 781.70 TaxID=1392243 RepID=A0A6G1FTL8_9PEZI|nr:Arabinanase/levansucrase/invertase [Eremomyces bilateralis CBS 781.70]KAF1809019.1 Arabinanase/levansucrase/invertase [Eremomyces bilateralis CBS 781.70]
MLVIRALLSVLTLSAFASAAKFSNPLRKTDGSDPFIVYDTGYYYLLTTTWKDVQITRASTIEGLKTGEKKVVWRDSNKDRCCNVWAPEIAKIDGRWYLYYTAGQTTDLGFQRPFVLRGGASPWDTYAFHGRLSNEWGIDGSIARINDVNYFVWSCQAGGLQSLCIAKLEAPNRIGARTVLSQPTQSWEKAQGELPVNEGPVLLEHNGQYHVVYSASFCWTPSYALGLLTLRSGGNPLDARAWTKTGQPIFKSGNNNYGPGHNSSFFKSPDGKEDWNVFHATSNRDGACDGNRYTSVQKVNWNTNGTPNLGSPVPLNQQFDGPSGEPA